MGLAHDPLAPAPLLAHHPLATHPQAQKARAAVRHLQVQCNSRAAAQNFTECPNRFVSVLPLQDIVWC